MTATAGQAAYEALHASVARRQPGHHWLTWDAVNEINDGIPGEPFREDLEAAAQSAIGWQRAEDATPTAEDFDHAAEIMRLRDLLDDFTHAVIDLDDGARIVGIDRIAKAARSVRKKAGLPELTN